MLILYHFLHISIFSIAILTARPASSSARAPRLRSSAPPARCPCRQRSSFVQGTSEDKRFYALIRISCDDLGPFHESPHGLVQVHSNYTKNHICRAELLCLFRRANVSSLTERRRAQILRRETRLKGRSGQDDACEE